MRGWDAGGGVGPEGGRARVREGGAEAVVGECGGVAWCGGRVVLREGESGANRWLYLFSVLAVWERLVGVVVVVVVDDRMRCNLGSRLARLSWLARPLLALFFDLSFRCISVARVKHVLASDHCSTLHSLACLMWRQP